MDAFYFIQKYAFCKTFHTYGYPLTAFLYTGTVEQGSPKNKLWAMGCRRLVMAR
jgi:hypothetical protein